MRQFYRNKRYRDYGWKNSDDRRQAFARCLELSDGEEVEAQLLLDWLSYRASKLVRQEWGKIHNLAFKLLEFRKLSGDQVTAIFHNGSNGR